MRRFRAFPDEGTQAKMRGKRRSFVRHRGAESEASMRRRGAARTREAAPHPTAHHSVLSERSLSA